jgi:regulator of protease activity HflC (stomatin/prohibitin superfamily)
VVRPKTGEVANFRFGGSITQGITLQMTDDEGRVLTKNGQRLEFSLFDTRTRTRAPQDWIATGIKIAALAFLIWLGAVITRGVAAAVGFVAFNLIILGLLAVGSGCHLCPSCFGLSTPSGIWTGKASSDSSSKRSTRLINPAARCRRVAVASADSIAIGYTVFVPLVAKGTGGRRWICCLISCLKNPTTTIIVAVVLFVIVLLRASLRVLPEWERAVVLRLGRFQAVKGPGLIFLIPIIDVARIVDTRIVTMNVPRQEAVTKDNVSVTVDAVVLFKVVNPRDAVVQITDYIQTSSLIAQTTLRSVIGQAELDDLLARRDKINQQLQSIIDEQTEAFGVKVTSVEVRDVTLPEEMKRALAKQAESERERRAKVIAAEGEYQAAERLVQAAERIAQQPAALQLRYLQTLVEIASERNSTVVFPIPIELIRPFFSTDQTQNTPPPNSV